LLKRKYFILDQGCLILYLHTQNPNFVIFYNVLECKILSICEGHLFFFLFLDCYTKKHLATLVWTVFAIVNILTGNKNLSENPIRKGQRLGQVYCRLDQRATDGKQF
jgi:hypothetical protein